MKFGYEICFRHQERHLTKRFSCIVHIQSCNDDPYTSFGQLIAHGSNLVVEELGFIKSHQIAYLEPRLHSMVASLGAGERTPVFLIGGSWDRFSWYLRLPGPTSHPWAGIARVECAANVTAAEVIELAHLSQAVLPRFASEEFKDPRAPQNLYPVGALEKELRRRLGHPGLVYRALRQASHA